MFFRILGNKTWTFQFGGVQDIGSRSFEFSRGSSIFSRSNPKTTSNGDKLNNKLKLLDFNLFLILFIYLNLFPSVC